MSNIEKIKQLSVALDQWEKIETKARERELFLVLNGFTDMVVVADIDGKIVFANESSYRVLGYDPTELSGKNVTILMSSTDALTHTKKMNEYTTNKPSQIVGKGREVIAKHKEGYGVPVFINVGQFQEQNHKYFIGILHKIRR